MSDIKELLKTRKIVEEKISIAVTAKLKTFGGRIKQMRKENGYTQDELAEMLTISRTQLTNIEIGNSGLTLGNVILLSEIFGTHPNYLLGYSD